MSSAPDPVELVWPLHRWHYLTVDPSVSYRCILALLVEQYGELDPEDYIPSDDELEDDAYGFYLVELARWDCRS